MRVGTAFMSRTVGALPLLRAGQEAKPICAQPKGPRGSGSIVLPRRCVHRRASSSEAHAGSCTAHHARTQAHVHNVRAARLHCERRASAHLQTKDHVA